MPITEKNSKSKEEGNEIRNKKEKKMWKQEGKREWKKRKNKIIIKK